MAFCNNCGAELIDGAKFCQKCGCPIRESARKISEERQREFAGKIYKCPNCGEVLKSFEAKCPACGLELRGTKATNSVREFALKLEAIEARREPEKVRGIYAQAVAMQEISKTDAQKINLIQSFAVPNTKEDILEFMILATSSMNMGVYDSYNTSVTKSERELNAAWFAKVQQVYEKAKRSCSSDDIFVEIKGLYDKCNEDIKKSKKKGIFKWLLLLGWIPVLLAVSFIWMVIYSPISENKEVARLDAIVVEIETQLENGEYKYALMNANTLVYNGAIINEEQRRQWKIEREYWIDRVIEEAAKNGIVLERPVGEGEPEETGNDSKGGFVEGFKDAVQPAVDSAKEKIDEFNRIINGEKSTDEQHTEN